MGALSGLGGVVSAALAVVFPMFAPVRAARRLPRPVFWALHALVVLLAVALLVAVQRWRDLDQMLVLPAPWLRGAWLALLFALVYALGWLGRWLWDLLGSGQEALVFPDIDSAWREAVRALDQAGVDLSAAPVFLVLGRPRNGEDGLFHGVQPKPTVVGIPRSPSAPLRVYANRDAIFVTCAGASLAGRQAEQLAEQPAGGTSVTMEVGPVEDDEDAGYFATLAPAAQNAAEAVEQIIARARAEGRDVAHLTEEERTAIGKLTASRDVPEVGGGRPRNWVLQNREEADLFTARLRYLAGLIGRERAPFCPINGVLLLVPVAAGLDEQAASQFGLVAQRDLATIRQTARVNCPVFALVCDLETLPGFRELTARLPADQRERRMGQRFPLVPDVDPANLPAMIEGGVQQIGNRLIPNLVSNLWRVEPAGGTYAEAVRGNVELSRLLGEVRNCQSRLARVLSRAVVPESGPPHMLGGCYLAATGPDPAREQAFVPGVLHRLVESQDFVAWTPEALAEDSSFARWAGIGYAVLTVASLASLGYAAFVRFGAR